MRYGIAEPGVTILIPLPYQGIQSGGWRAISSEWARNGPKADVNGCAVQSAYKEQEQGIWMVSWTGIGEAMNEEH